MNEAERVRIGQFEDLVMRRDETSRCAARMGVTRAFERRSLVTRKRRE